MAYSFAYYGASTAWHSSWTRVVQYMSFVILCLISQCCETVKAYTRAWLQQRSYRQQVAGIVTIQKLVRGYLVRKSEARRRSAAITIQARWRQICCKRAYQTSRTRIITLQAHVRGLLARCQLAKEHAAATVIQTRWRQHRSLQCVQQLRSCMLVQRCWRQQQAQQLLQQHKAARTIQSHYRRHHAQCQLHQTRSAAIMVQSLYRARTVRAWFNYNLAMIRFQQAIAEWNNKRIAATYIQRVWRGYHARKLMEPVWEAHRQAKLQAEAALFIQACWRGYEARREAQKRRDALSVIGQYLPQMRARCQLLRARRAVRTIQLAWRRYDARRAQAAVVVQAAVRGWQARQNFQDRMRGICRLQALWRGYCARKASGKAGKEARRRIQIANEDAERNPHKRLFVRMQEALQALLNCKSPATAMTAVEKMRHFTQYSKNCCKLLVESGGAAQLLNFIRNCNRSKPHVDLVCCAVNILLDVARYPELIQPLFASKDCINILSERLQFYRDMEDVFMVTLSLLARLVSPPALAAEASTMTTTVRQWEGISQLLVRKVQAEKMYISRLEGQKGSDVAAREATRKMISATQQHEALQAVITHVAMHAPDNGALTPRTSASSLPTTATSTSTNSPGRMPSLIPGAPLPMLTETGVVAPVSVEDVVAPVQWKPKNTICRETVKEIAHKKSFSALKR